MFALVASVDKTVLSLVVELDQHAHGAPPASPERAEFPVLVPGQSQESVAAVHEVTGEHGVGVNNGRQGVDHGCRVEVDHKEHLQCTRQRENSEKRKLVKQVFEHFHCFAFIITWKSYKSLTSLCFSIVA